MWRAYEAVFARYHGWLARSMFMGSAKAAPGSAQLLRLLAPAAGGAVREGLVLREMEQFSAAAEPVADAIEAALASAGLVDERRV